MALTARLDLAVWRNDDHAWEYPLIVRGADLTNAGLAMQVRSAPDTPGAPLINLLGVTNGNAEGLRVAGVSTVDGLPQTDLRIRINKSTLQGLPYMGELGQPAEFSYALLLSGITRLVGKLILLAHAYGSDNAPTNRPGGFANTSTTFPSGGATLTISGTETTILNLDGAGLLGPVAALAAEQAQAAQVITGTLIGAPAALPIGNNPNDLIAKVANADNEQPFEVLIVDTNTGQSFLETAGAFRRRIARDGGGADLQPGDLTKGKIATFQYSAGGGRFILTGTRDIDESGTGEVIDPDLANKPWGTVTYASGGTGARTVTTITKYVTVVGSSNAHSDYVDAAHLPANVAAAALNEFHPGGGITYVADSQAQPGAPMVTIASQLGASSAFQAGTSRHVLTMYGMNDARTLFYHDNGGIMAEIAALEAAIETIRAGGAEPVLNTIFPPDPRSSTIALDPNYYADTAAYPAGGSTRAMDFPAYHAAPVSPQNHMEPRLNQLTEVRDWTGAGTARTGYKRIWHVNYLVRQIATKYGCALLDFEFAAYRNAIETVADLGAGLNTFYNSADPLHPLMPLYAAAVTPVIRQWALAVSRGEVTGRVFTGAA